MFKDRHCNAFSLVELSIVLVILGLLVGGVLSGQSLIHAAQLRSVSEDYSKFTVAAYSFRDKYFALPGDMTNATSFWGIAAGATGSDNTCRAAPGVGTKTCNGDGDGMIMGTQTGPGLDGYNEWFRFWQHLANAGLIEGSYTGTDGVNSGNANSFVAGLNSPPSKIGNGGLWYASYALQSAGDAADFANPGSNYMRITTNNTGIMTPTDAWNVDTKMDDGMPGTGKMIIYKGDGVTNFSTSKSGVAPPGDAGATYNFQDTTMEVNPLFFF